jgi:hypothetical protein
MKKIKYVNLKNGDYEIIGRRISNITYFDFQTKGEKAKANVVRILKDYVNIDDVKSVILQDDRYNWETEGEMFEEVKV